MQGWQLEPSRRTSGLQYPHQPPLHPVCQRLGPAGAPPFQQRRVRVSQPHFLALRSVGGSGIGVPSWSRARSMPARCRPSPSPLPATTHASRPPDLRSHRKGRGGLLPPLVVPQAQAAGVRGAGLGRHHLSQVCTRLAIQRRRSVQAALHGARGAAWGEVLRGMHSSLPAGPRHFWNRPRALRRQRRAPDAGEAQSSGGNACRGCPGSTSCCCAAIITAPGAAQGRRGTEPCIHQRQRSTQARGKKAMPSCRAAPRPLLRSCTHRMGTAAGRSSPSQAQAAPPTKK